MHETPFLPYLVAVAKDARTTASVGRGKVAAAGDIDQDTVRRFEAEMSWKRETDKLIQGYAAVAGRAPIDIWRDALEDWATALAAADDGPMPGPDPGVLERAVRDSQPSQPTAGRNRRRSPDRRKRSA